jgi:hypothetical protein
MTIDYKELKSTILSIYSDDINPYSAYISDQLQKPFFLQLIEEIMQKSSKTASEAILVIVASVCYLHKEKNALSILKEQDKFEDFVKENRLEILNLSIQRKVQANIIERGLPLLEILSKKLPGQSICLIELGASYGLIGSCLLQPQKMLENKTKYFKPNQQFPKSIQAIDYYLGIDIDPPVKDWLLACIYDEGALSRISDYINDIHGSQNFNLIKSSAIGFSRLKEVIALKEQNYTLVILNSFMLYQFPEELKNTLTNEIVDFCTKNNAHWIKQEVDINETNLRCYIDWDGKQIIELPDDKCGDWTWIE